jgi:hypothetical protein
MGGWRELTRAHVVKPVSPGVLLAFAAIVAITAVATCAWLFDRDLYFRADDWDWLARAHFYQGSDQAGLLPQKPYNDRPVGAFLIRLGYRAFGLSPQAFHAAAVFVHAFNALLAFALALRLLPAHRALIAGVLSAAWFAANDAVAWTAAVFDLAGATFCLGAVLLYGLEGKRKWLWRLGAIACHVLAIRTKEFGLGLLLALVAWELFAAQAPNWRRLLPHVVVTLVYGTAYALLLADSPTRGGPYALTFSPLAMLESAWAYLRMLGNGHVWGAVALTSVCIAHLVTRNRAGLFGMVAAIAFLAAVLPLAHQRFAFYLYAPHFFAALSVAALGFGRATSALSAGLAFILIATPLIDGSRLRAQRDLRADGRYAGTLHQDFRVWAAGREAIRGVVVHVADPAASPFLQGHARLTRFNPWLLGPGNAIKITLSNPHAVVRVPATRAEAVAECRALQLPLLVERAGRLIDATSEASCLASGPRRDEATP